MKIAVANPKGGVGKTMISVQISIERARIGRKVLLADGDPQKTSSNATTVRMRAGIEPVVMGAHLPHGDEFFHQVANQGALYDDVVMDVGGFDSEALRSALVLADVLLVPVHPRAFDSWALGRMSQLIQDANRSRVMANRSPVTTYCILSKADPLIKGKHTSDNLSTIEAIDHFETLPYLEAPLVDRKSFALSAAMGLSVEEMPKAERDEKACEELRTLMAAIFENVIPPRIDETEEVTPS